MDPNHTAIFQAIVKSNTKALRDALTLTPHGAWVLNDNNLSAFDFALEINDHASLNVMLSVMHENLKNLSPSIVHEQIFDFALLKCVRHFSENFEDLAAYKRFFDRPETQFTFLENAAEGWIAWPTSPTAASNAATETVLIKPKIYRMIRAHAFGSVLSNHLRFYSNAEISDTLKNLRLACIGWRTQPIFNEHRNMGASFIKSTDSVAKLSTMISAITILTDNDDDLPENITIEQAQSIMILCAKSYPFSPPSLQTYWAELVQDLFEIFDLEPKSIKLLYTSLMDKHWLFTGKYIPFAQTHVLDKLPQKTVARVLDVFGENAISLALLSNEPLPLYAGQGMELLTLHPDFAHRKQIILEAATLDQGSQNIIHMAMMKNPEIQISAPNNQLFDENPFQHYPQSTCKMIFRIDNLTQLMAFNRQVVALARVQPHVYCTVPHRLLQEAGALPALQIIQQSLGPKQTVTVNIVADTGAAQTVLADMIFGKNTISAGKLMLAKQAKQPAVFFTLYQKFPWSIYADAPSVEHNLHQNLPLFFIVSHLNFDAKIFADIQAKLNDKNPTCYIRVDEIDFVPNKESTIPTHCDFIVTKTVVKPGPLFSAALCSEPSLFAQASPPQAPVVVSRGKAPAANEKQPKLTVGQYTIKHS